MLANDGLHGRIAPHVTVEYLASEFFVVLDIYHKPFVFLCAGILCLFSAMTY